MKKIGKIMSVVAFVMIGVAVLPVGGPIGSNEIIQPLEQWNKTFGGTESDCSNSVQQTSDGSYIIAGFTESFGAGNKDVWLIQIDAKGSMLLNKTIGGSELDEAFSVQQTTDEGYVISGFTHSFGGEEGDALVIKTDAELNILWNKTFGGEKLDKARVTRYNPEEEFYIITGFTESFGAGNRDVWLIQIDDEGNMLLNKTFGGSEMDEAGSVQQTTDNGFIVAGYTTSFGAGKGDAWLIKTDAQGNMEWDKTFGGSEWDAVHSIQQTLDGGYVMTGFTNSFGAGNLDIWLIKTDSNGNEQWNKTFGGIDGDIGYSIQQTLDGDYICAGNTKSFGAGKGDAWLIKTNAKGNMLWNKTFGGEEVDRGYSVQQTSDGGIILTGETSSYGAGASDVWLIKIASDSQEININPNTLNLKSKGKWVMCIIELSEGYDVADINQGTIYLEEDIPAEKPVLTGHSLNVKFDRSDLEDKLSPGDDIVLTVTGQLTDGKSFSGIDTIRVIDPGK